MATTAEKFYEDNDMHDTPPVPCNLVVGSRVMFTNDYGNTFGPYRVIGFSRPSDISYGRFVYLDWSSPWFPTTLKSLRLIE